MASPRKRAAWRAFAASVALTFAGLALALETGNSLPAVSVKTAGGSVDFAKLRGKVVYVDFWASWCGPCKQSFPWMNDMHAKYAARGLEIIAVNVDAKAADAERFLATTPAKFTIAFDPKGETPRQFAVKAMPTSFLVDGDGKITLIHAGFKESDRAVLDSAFAAATAALTTQDKARK